MLVNSFTDFALEAQRHAWDEQKPFEALNDHNAVSRERAGMEEAVQLAGIPKDGPITILEVGVETGSSTRFFLNHFMNAKIVSIDPWVNNYPLPKGWEHLAEPARSDGGSLYKIFQSYSWKWKEQILPIRAWSHEGMKRAYDLGVVPDMIYVDGDHRYHGVFADLVLAASLYPKAVICGDDWGFAPTAAKYKGIQFPVRAAALDFAEHFERPISHFKNSYVIHHLG